MNKQQLAEYNLGINIQDIQLPDKPKYLVDNTFSTGKTFDSVKNFIPDIQPLGFSLGAKFLASH